MRATDPVLSAHEVADEIGVHYETVLDWNGKNAPVRRLILSPAILGRSELFSRPREPRREAPRA
jgi:hypothetical protein